MAKLLAQSRSAPIRHKASAAATAAPGVRSAATARAIRWFLLRLAAVLECLTNRILTRMTL
jgi:hypothetical protein